MGNFKVEVLALSLSLNIFSACEQSPLTTADSRLKAKAQGAPESGSLPEVNSTVAGATAVPEFSAWLPRGGAVEGGGLLRLYSADMSSNLQVLIGDQLCTAPKVVDGWEYECTIPSASEGSYDVKVCAGPTDCKTFENKYRYAKAVYGGPIEYFADGWFKSSELKPGLPRARIPSSSPNGWSNVGMTMAPDGRLIYNVEYSGQFMGIDTATGRYATEHSSPWGYKRGIFVSKDGYAYVINMPGLISRLRLSDNSDQGWIGKIGAQVPTGGADGCSTANANSPTPGWCAGGAATTGVGDGEYNFNAHVVLGIWGDDTKYLYVPDRLNHRIVRIETATGRFAGWIGKVGTAPSGSATNLDNGCNTTSIGNSTPGWCLGGSAAAGTGDNMFSSPIAVTGDGNGYLYVTDGDNNRIVKINRITGVFVGWSGRVATTPTGSAGACTMATVGLMTPGWCSGGTAQSGTGDGSLSGPQQIAHGFGKLYVTDTGNERLTRFNASTGAFEGWIGVVATSPTSGFAGCSATAVDKFTPGWCFGGTSKQNSAVEPFFVNIRAVAVDPQNRIYVGGWGMLLTQFNDDGNYIGSRRSVVVDTGSYVVDETISGGGGEGGLVISRDGFAYQGNWFSSGIRKYRVSNGEYIGWVGRVNVTPTGGAEGCKTTLAGQQTPGWCKGGNAAGVAINQMPSATAAHVDGIAVDENGVYIYAVGRGDSRIVRYRASDGRYAGWIGLIGTKATGGSAGCASAAVGTFTPGWCFGGTPQVGNATNGGLSSSLFGVAYSSSGYLYVGDLNRISRYVASTGQYAGWIGMIGASPTGGASGCNGAAVGTFTPGWCIGGSASSNSGGSGGLKTAKNLHVNDAIGMLYIGDWDQSAVNRYDLSTGAFRGWIGTIAASPTGAATGGPSSCVSAPVNSMTPGWCTGGYAKSGQFRSVMSCASNGNGKLYVASFFSSTGGHGGSDLLSIVDEESGAYIGLHNSFVGVAQPVSVVPLSDGTVYTLERNGSRFVREMP